MALMRPHDQPGQTRDVWIVTVPIKDPALPRRSAVSWMARRADLELDWSMHWALLVGDQYFELQRTSRSLVPVLRVSVWSAERVASIRRTRRVGISQLRNDQISEAGKKFHYMSSRNFEIVSCYSRRLICSYYPI